MPHDVELVWLSFWYDAKSSCGLKAKDIGAGVENRSYTAANRVMEVKRRTTKALQLSASAAVVRVGFSGGLN